MSKQSERIRELEEKIAFYECVFDNIRALVYLNTLKGTVWSNKFCRETLHTPEEVQAYGVEKYTEEFYHPDDKHIFEDSKKYLNDKSVGHSMGIYRQKGRDGEWHTLLGTTRVLKYDPTGMVSESINCAIEITEKFAEFTQLESILKETAYLKNRLKLEKLSKREKEVFKLLGEGLSTKEIASCLFISSHTVESHRKNMMKKLETPNTAALVRLGTECGI